MKRLDGKDVAARPPQAVARDRYATTRILAALLCALAGAGLSHLHLVHAPPGRWDDVTPIYVGASLCGLFAGWRILGLRLGRGLRAAASRALTTGAAGLALFCLAAGGRSVVESYGYSRYRDAMELFQKMIEQGLETGAILLVSPALPAAGAAALIIGALCETLHGAWDAAELPEM